ncbi:GGDEF domain-containing protein [Acidobacteria bacterium AB60]|nr:GGDEF domain-containing protein [Acidobacteria bacterium AB60]
MRWFRVFGIVCLGAAPVALAEPAAAREAGLRVIQSARQVHDLTPAEALGSYPVHLRAVVTYYDPYIDGRHAALFIHDQSGAVFVALPVRPILPIKAGDLVDVQGVSGMGDYAPIVIKAQVGYVGPSHVPERPIRATLAQLLTPILDGQWVQVEGVVRAVRSSRTNVILDLATPGGSLAATTIREANVNYDALIDARVRVSANAAPVFNKKRQMVGVHLFFPGMKQLTVLQAAAADPFARPAIPLPAVLQFTPGVDVAHRVHVQGRVTLRWPGRTLCIQQGNDGLCMETSQATPVKSGDLIDAVGFPAISNYRATLEYAAYRVTAGGAASPIAPRVISASDAFRPEHDSELVQLEGEVVGQEHAGGDQTILVRAGPYLIPGIMPGSSFDAAHLAIKDQSVVRLTGICRSQINSEDTNFSEGEIRAGAVQLLLDSASGVQVVKVASWWTRRNTLGVLALVALVSLVTLVWVVVLRRQVNRQTHALRRSEERLRHLSEHDALTGLPNRNLLNDRMGMALQRARRFHQRIALLMVDLDRFKEVNDAQGHRAGDQVLCEIAHRLRSSVRMTDTVARIGGDEFIVLLPDLNQPEEAELVAGKVLAAVAAPIPAGQQPVALTVSVGVCRYPEGGETIEELMENVDTAMYAAKAQGRNGFEVYRPVLR